MPVRTSTLALLGMAAVLGLGPGCAPAADPSAALVGTWKLESAVLPRTEPDGDPVDVRRPTDLFLRFYPDGTAAAWPLSGGKTYRWTYRSTVGPATVASPGPVVPGGFVLTPDHDDGRLRFEFIPEGRWTFGRVRPDLEPGSPALAPGDASGSPVPVIWQELRSAPGD